MKKFYPGQAFYSLFEDGNLSLVFIFGIESNSNERKINYLFVNNRTYNKYGIEISECYDWQLNDWINEKQARVMHENSSR